MKTNVTLFKSLSLAFVFFTLGLTLNAQNLVVNGDMPAHAENDWTVGHRGGSLPVVEFGIEENIPTGAESTTVASIPWGSGWAETQLWQVVTLEAGVTYTLEAMLYGEIKEASTWVQGYLMPWMEPDASEGANSWSDANIGQAVQLLQVNGWVDDSEVINTIDGPFPKNIEENPKFLIGESVTPEETGDWVVLFKLGGNQPEVSTAYLTDVVVSASTTAVNVLDSPVVKVYPSIADSYVTVVGLSSIANTIICNASGSIISSGVVSNGQQIEVSNLTPGVYFLQVEDGMIKTTHKFVKR